jgi:6-phosphogluconolactonase (cycloisomerase 2 family)
MNFVFIGGYTPGAGGSGPGITVARRKGDGALAGIGKVAVVSPSFLAVHPRLPVLYAVGECEKGLVTAFAIDPDGGLHPIAQVSSGGSIPCHLAVDPAGRILAVANYGDGVLSIYRLNDTGGLDGIDATFPHTGHGPHPDRQLGPHAHQVIFGGDGILYVTDLGTDEIRRYLTSPEVTPHPEGSIRLPPGAGPRHTAVHQDGWLVANELNGRVAAYDSRWRELARVPASTRPGPNAPSHIAVHDGHLYVANRGPDTISVFRVNGLVRVAEVPCGGSWPRHFAIHAPHMYVAAQHSDVITVLELKSGVPTPTDLTFAVGSPACVLL